MESNSVSELDKKVAMAAILYFELAVNERLSTVELEKIAPKELMGIVNARVHEKRAEIGRHKLAHEEFIKWEKAALQDVLNSLGCYRGTL